MRKQYKAASEKDQEEWDTANGIAGTILIPEHLVWVCGACGKTSRAKYGFDENNKRVSQPGYDESCMMNSVLCLAKPIRAELIKNRRIVC